MSTKTPDRTRRTTGLRGLRRGAGQLATVVAGLERAVVAEIDGLSENTDPALREYLSRRINRLLIVVALVMFAVAWPTLFETHVVHPVLAPVFAAFAAFPIAFAWQWPTRAWGVSAASAWGVGILLSTTNGWEWGIQVVHIIELFVLTFAVYLRAPGRTVLLVWLGTCVTFMVWAPSDSEREGWALGFTVGLVICVLVRLVVRSSGALRREESVSAAARSVNAVLTERARIARDLHDVVAHRMSVVVVQAQTARYRVPDVGEAAAAEFEAIAGVAREALSEVRVMLGVLRVEDDGAAQAPNPGLADIARLVEDTRGAGIAVAYEPDTSSFGEVSDSSALVAYRIVQESLTNATRHAPGSSVAVAVSIEPEVLSVTVTNSAPKTLDHGVGRDLLAAAGGGHGIRGMHERASAVGGSLSAAPVEGGGFVVVAVLPTRAQG